MYISEGGRNICLLKDIYFVFLLFSFLYTFLPGVFSESSSYIKILSSEFRCSVGGVEWGFILFLVG